jgi:putative ATPase
MRPKTLDDISGQDHLLATGAPLRRLLDKGVIPSMILWGPPGCGKTTTAKAIAGCTPSQFTTLSAVTSGVGDLKKVAKEAEELKRFSGKRMILFVDELHRFNKAQQDCLLPFVESGLVTLIGATTENPSFELNSALLSRCRVYVLNRVPPQAISQILDSAMTSERGLKHLGLTLSQEAKNALEHSCHGDARHALGSLEISSELAHADGDKEITLSHVERASQRKLLLYDKNGDEHFAVVSAFIKSMRGSDPDAAVYWLTRMIESGEDPLFICRRMVIFASEDIGNADPGAMRVALDAMHSFKFIGLPEGVLPLTQAAIYLALAPKSNTALTSYTKAHKLITETGPLPVPNRLKNATSGLNKSLGHGSGYKYPHNFDGHYVPESYLPDTVADKELVTLSTEGQEKKLQSKLAELRQDRTKED